MNGQSTEKSESEPFGKTFPCLFITITIIYLLNKNLKITIYPICILFSFMLIMIISGKIEINFGNIIRIKKGIEEIKKEVAELRLNINQKLENKVESKTEINTFISSPIEDYPKGDS